jgi:hypothetical protein
MTNDRLESFRTAFQNLDVMPLVTPDRLEPTSSRLDRKKVILGKVDLKYQK